MDTRLSLILVSPSLETRVLRTKSERQLLKSRGWSSANRAYISVSPRRFVIAFIVAYLTDNSEKELLEVNKEHEVELRLTPRKPYKNEHPQVWSPS